MPSAATILHYLTHPNQLRAVAQYKIWHEPLHQRDVEKESPNLRRSYELLDMTSRSFSAVIQELQPEMRVAITVFYLILRGLDTVEDDMTLPLEKKEPILRNFDAVLDTPGWTFTESGPKERDRQLLVEFNVVIEEFAKLKDVYRDVIKDITKQMGNGMADYVRDADHNLNGVQTVADYDKYCWYVAGLVGEGLTRLFVPAGVANPALLSRPNLFMSMGLFLQKTNIIRDYAEDLADKRSFYPKEIWSKYVDQYVDLADPKNEEAALNCNSDMVLNALGHADECLFYLAGLKDQSVFNFCAIPQTMAIATLALIFRNKDLYHKNVKIPKGEACELMLETGNLRTVCAVFRKYLHIIRKKNTPRDPNFLKISIACGKVEQFIESIFPSQDLKEQQTARREARLNIEPEREVPGPDEREQTSGEVFFLMIVVLATMTIMSIVMIGAAWLVGARFDIAWENIDKNIREFPIIGPFLDGIQGPGKLLGGNYADVSGTATEAMMPVPEPLGDL